MKRRIYTVGYATWTAAELLQTAIAMNATVIDIRTAARSSRPDFSEVALRRLMCRRYHRIRQWGNVNYQGGPIEIADFSEGLRELSGISGDVILMCGCMHFADCHRCVIAQRLRAIGIESEELMRPYNPSVKDGQIPVLSLWQPWASLVVFKDENGRCEKAFETRHWVTDYRGTVAVYATLKWDREIKDYCLSEPFRPVLSAHLGIPLGCADADYLKAVREGLPFGAIVGTARIVDVVRSEVSAGPVAEFGGRHETSFGDYRPGRAGFLLADVVRLAEPVVIKGQQGWFNVPLSLLDGAVEARGGQSVKVLTTPAIVPVTRASGQAQSLQMDLFG